MKKMVRCLTGTAVSVLFVIAVASFSYAGPLEQRINERIKSLQTQIDAEVKLGELTPTEKAMVQTRLNRVNAQANKANDIKYGLGNNEVKAINAELDAIARTIDKKSHNLQSAHAGDLIINKINGLQKQIDSGYNDGSLNGTEAKNLNNRLDTISKQYNRKAKNGLSEQEVKDINTDLEQLGKNIIRKDNNKRRAL